MSIETFYSDFTSDLESFVKNPIQLEPITKWSPNRVAAPERHIQYGKGRTPEELLHCLQSHSATEMIESMLRIYMTSETLATLQTINPVKEQVWLFGYQWLSTYYSRLVEPTVTRSEFYRVHHQSFLNLLRTMLQVHPQNRCSFVQALREWCPSSSLLQEIQIPLPAEEPRILLREMPSKSQPGEPLDSYEQLESTLETPANDAPSVSVSGSSSASSSAALAKPRLVLTRPSDPEERNKTRRSRRS